MFDYSFVNKIKRKAKENTTNSSSAENENRQLNHTIWCVYIKYLDIWHLEIGINLIKSIQWVLTEPDGNDGMAIFPYIWTKFI